MRKAIVVTIGTEITCGEIVNTNAAWVSERLEERGVRVFAHISVRDHAGEIARALAWSKQEKYDLAVVTGGLGPTTDDITRKALADFAGVGLEFDEAAWTELGEQHRGRGLGVRDSHRHQCYFPVGSERLPNPVGTALGFAQVIDGCPYYTLPGPPRELQGIWTASIESRLSATNDRREWVRWTCLGAPESEIADLTEAVIAGHDVEVGYRAQVPYVKVKVYVDRTAEADLLERLDRALAPFVVARGRDDLAEQVLGRWPQPTFELVDRVTGTRFLSRIATAKAVLGERSVATPHLTFAPEGLPPINGIYLFREDDEFVTELRLNGVTRSERRTLPFKTPLTSERGQRSVVEWALWHIHRALETADVL